VSPSLEVLLLAASAAHLGFQAVVTVVVYPALASVRREDWSVAHEAHSRRISLVVGPLYLAVAAACLATLLDGPSAAALVAVGGNALAALSTALVAAPTHGRLGSRGPEPALLRTLRRADVVRTLGAAVATVGALVALG